LLEVGHKEVLVIDGVDGNHRVESRSKFQLFADETRRLARSVIRQYQNDPIMKNTVISDINNLERKSA